MARRGCCLRQPEHVHCRFYGTPNASFHSTSTSSSAWPRARACRSRSSSNCGEEILCAAEPGAAGPGATAPLRPPDRCTCLALNVEGRTVVGQNARLDRGRRRTRRRLH